MREKFIPALRQKQGVVTDGVIYQQDGETPHCCNASLEYLHRYFLGDRLISRRMVHSCLTFSTPMPFGLFSHTKLTYLYNRLMKKIAKYSFP